MLHMHSLNGVAVSATKDGVLPVSQQSIFVLSSLAYHDYEGVALLEGEKPRLVRDLGDKSFFMLRNHGLLTVGASIADAFLLMYIFESACTIQLRAQAASSELIPIDQKIVAGAQMMAKQVTRSAGGALAWPGLLRKLDRIDRSYREAILGDAHREPRSARVQADEARLQAGRPLSSRVPELSRTRSSHLWHRRQARRPRHPAVPRMRRVPIVSQRQRHGRPRRGSQLRSGRVSTLTVTPAARLSPR